MHLDKIKTKMYEGDEIPWYVQTMTRHDGLMKVWLRNLKEHMVAFVAYVDDEPVGWSCYVRTNYLSYDEPYVKLGVFIPTENRSHGIGAFILDEMLAHLAEEKPGIECLYGAPSDSYHFNETYERLIAKHGLLANKFYAPY